MVGEIFFSDFAKVFVSSRRNKLEKGDVSRVLVKKKMLMSKAVCSVIGSNRP